MPDLNPGTKSGKRVKVLADRIINAGGALLSEYPLGVPALKQHFVARNRIISGMCVGTLVIEGDLESGALMTARHALDQNRNVYAVPGPLYSPGSRGPNHLLKMGAKPVTEANDILEDLHLEKKMAVAQDYSRLSNSELSVMEQLEKDHLHTDSLARLTRLEPGALGAILTFLEVKGLVRSLGNGYYAKNLRPGN